MPYQDPYLPGNSAYPYSPGAFPGFAAPGRDAITQALMNQGANMPAQNQPGGTIAGPTIGVGTGAGSDASIMSGTPPIGAGMVAQPSIGAGAGMIAQPTIGMGGGGAQPPGMGGGVAAPMGGAPPSGMGGGAAASYNGWSPQTGPYTLPHP